MKSINNQAQNKVSISGKLLDVSFSSGKTKKGVPYERANVTVRVVHLLMAAMEVIQQVFLIQLKKQQYIYMQVELVIPVELQVDLMVEVAVAHIMAVAVELI